MYKQYKFYLCNLSPSPVDGHILWFQIQQSMKNGLQVEHLNSHFFIVISIACFIQQCKVSVNCTATFFLKIYQIRVASFDIGHGPSLAPWLTAIYTEFHCKVFPICEVSWIWKEQPFFMRCVGSWWRWERYNTSLWKILTVKEYFKH